MIHQTLQSTLNSQLQELYSVEAHLGKELKHYVQGVTSAEIKSQLLKACQEAEQHAQVLFAQLLKRNINPHEGKSRLIDALLKTGGKVIQSRGDDAVIDAELLCGLRTIELVEQSCYENALTIAEALGEVEVVKVLETHLREEGQRERSWTVLLEDMVDSIVAAASRTKHGPTASAEGVQP